MQEAPCGSGAGAPHPKEEEVLARLAADGVPSRSRIELAAMRHTVAAAIRDTPGTVPGDWDMWAEAEVTPPRVPWQRHLSRIRRRTGVVAQGRLDYTYGRVSRRQGVVGWAPGSPILAAMHASVPRILVAADTSGSMHGKGGDVLSEVNGILRAAAAEVTLLAIDAKIHVVEPVRTIQEARTLLRGGGGTSFLPLFRYVDTLPRKPDLVVVCTDGWGPAPADPPGYATTWVLVGAGATAPCRWGDHVYVEP
jgi:predicted metal-dependent peptidase